MKPLTFLLVLVLAIYALLLLWGHTKVICAPPSPAVRTVSVPWVAVVERDPADFDEGGREFAAPAMAMVTPALPSNVRTIAGRLSATEERAHTDARLQLERAVADWIAPEVPSMQAHVVSNPDLAPTKLPYRWRVPAQLIDQMIRETRTKPIVRDYGTVYEASILADFSTENRAAIIAAYQHDLVAYRLTLLAGVIGFLLTCLAALAGYIRADEATRGYYTHWLRAVAAAGVGASGVLIYQMLT